MFFCLVILWRRRTRSWPLLFQNTQPCGCESKQPQTPCSGFYVLVNLRSSHVLQTRKISSVPQQLPAGGANCKYRMSLICSFLYLECRIYCANSLYTLGKKQCKHANFVPSDFFFLYTLRVTLSEKRNSGVNFLCALVEQI